MRRFSAAVFVALLFPGPGADGQGSLDCGPLNPDQCMYRDWKDPSYVSPQWLDTMDTWTAAADWQDTEDCSKVRNAAKQVIVFGNRNPAGAGTLWPVLEYVFWERTKACPLHPAAHTTTTRGSVR